MSTSLTLKLISPTRTDAYLYIGDAFSLHVRYSPWSEGLDILWESPCCTEPILTSVVRTKDSVGRYRMVDGWTEAECSSCNQLLPAYYALSPRDDARVLAHDVVLPALVAAGLDPITAAVMLPLLDDFILEKAQYCREAIRSINEDFVLELA